MHFAYAILPALSLLNMGVEGATIAKALTSKHSSEVHQARKVIHDRQFHNADFGSGSATSKDEKAPVAQATKHAARGSFLHDITSDELPTTATDKNGSGVIAKPNPAFMDLLLNSNPSRRSNDLSTTEGEVIQAPNVGGSTQGKVVSDSTSTGIDADDTKFPNLGAGEYRDTVATPISEVMGYLEDASLSSLSGGYPSLSDAGSLTSAIGPLTSDTAPVLSETTPFSGLPAGGLIRRQDIDSDQAEEVAEEVESVSTSLAGVSSLEGNSVMPQRFERRLFKEAREDGSLETDVGGTPVVLQPVPNLFSGFFNTRDVILPLPVNVPRELEPKSSVFPKRQADITDIEIKALGDAQSEDVKLV